MTLSPEQKIRLTSWGAAAALHLCAGVLILSAANFGGVISFPTRSQGDGVIHLTLARSALPATSSLAVSPPSQRPMVEPRPATLAVASAPSSAAPHPAPATTGADQSSVPTRAGAATSAGSSAFSAADADLFRQALLAHIDHYKRYPADLRRGGVQGTVWVRFVMDRSGRLQQAFVEQSSGQPALDDEALAAIRRAAPLPTIPSGLPDTIDMTLGIPFTLG